jgi:PAS domain S-box-containing protein
MALPHLLIGLKRRAWENLFFAMAALSVAALAWFELAIMHSRTPEEIGRAQQWAHLPIFLLVLAVAGFVHFYFGTGRLWIATAACVARLISLVINFASPPNVNFREITAVGQFNFLGETVAIPEGMINPWTHLGELSSLLMFVFVVDASLKLWRRGTSEDRRRVGVVGGSIALFIILAAGWSALIHAKVIHMPYLISLPFLVVILAMGFELSHDVLRAAQLAKQFHASEVALHESEARINLVADAANLGLWVWNIRNDELWVTEKWRKLFGFAESEPVNFDRLLQVVHAEDRERMKQLVQDMFEHGGEYESEYRIARSDGSTCWIAGHGSVEVDEDGKPAFARGVSRDITKRKIAEEESHESERRFRTVADAAPVLIWMSGPDKRCTFFNKGWLEFTGRTMEQEMGNGWAEGVHPDDLQRCSPAYTAAFDSREPFVMQYRLRRYDGEYRWMSDNGVPRYDVQKNFAGYIGSCMDVTDLISKEEALRDSEERMSLAANAARLVVWTWDIRRDEVWLSDKDRALFGFSQREKITAERVRDVVHPEDRQFVRQLVENSLIRSEEIEAEYRVVPADGKVRWVTRRGRVEFDAQGKPAFERGILMDITERKQAEDKFRLVVEASPNGIILVDGEGRIVLVNSQAEKLFGYAREEMIGRAIEVLVPERFRGAHPAYRGAFLAAPEKRSMGRGRELFARRKDGSEFPVEIGLNPVRTPEGMLVLAAVVDITARKEAEVEHQRQNTELARVGRVAVMGELTASLAHEVNNPIGAIVANARTGERLLATGKIRPEELTELLADIVADGRRAGEIIQGIRNMVRKGEARRSLVPINETIHDLLRIVHAEAVGREVKVTAEVDSNPGQVWGDPVQLLQVLLNLTINAFEAMTALPSDARHLLIRAGRDGNGGVLVSVRDSGPGLPEGIAQQLFEPFFSTKAEGTGMGLAIARSIIEAHGGTLSGETCADGGACFTVRLPQAKEDKSKVV